MRSIKPGRGPSAFGALGGIVGVLFGIFWTIMAYSMTRNAPEPFATFFPLFGVLFVVIGIVNVGYNLYNTTSKDRLSVLDVTSPREESDPLNEVFGSRDSHHAEGETTEEKLSELQSLRTKKLITEGEYAEQRRRILSEI